MSPSRVPLVVATLLGASCGGDPAGPGVDGEGGAAATSSTASASTGSTGGGAGGGAPSCPLGRDEPERVVDVRSWTDSILALTSKGDVYCWGNDAYYGCLGVGRPGVVHRPTRLPGLECIEKLTGDGRFAIDVEGRLWAWGTEFVEEHGNGHSLESPAVAARVPLEPRALSVTVSRETALAYTEDGLWSWGPIWNARTWDDPAGYVPSRHEGPTALLNEVLACDIDEDGIASCMGENQSGRNGDGTTEPTFELTPLAVEERFSRLWEAGGAFGLTLDGRLFAWGPNWDASLGIDAEDEESVLVPTELPGLQNVQGLALGGAVSCAFDDVGTASCWGVNTGGPLPDEDGDGLENVPVEIPDLSPTVALGSGRGFICSLKTDHSVWCRGEKWFRGLGSDAPDGGPATRVVFPFEEAP